MPIGDRLRRRHRRRVRDGDEYTIAEEDRGEIELEIPEPDPDPPPEETRGEPWGWTKGPPYPRGWREDGRYSDDRERGNPGPFDGSWGPPGARDDAH